VVIDHNTASQTGSILFGGDHAAHTGFVFQNNVMPHNDYGITGSGTGPGTPTLQKYFPEAVMRGNVLAGAPAAAYPAGGSTTDGREPGVDRAALKAALGYLDGNND
jgi:hypothetical protein